MKKKRNMSQESVEERIQINNFRHSIDKITPEQSNQKQILNMLSIGFKSVHHSEQVSQRDTKATLSLE